jgi:1-acyl-sn-glycerol-3-phosphate acyltransferase
MEKLLPKDKFDFDRFLQYVLGPPIRGIFHVEVVKKQPLKYGRWILSPNHTSAWDPVCLSASLPRSAYFIAKVELTNIMGPLLRALNGITIVRDSPDIKAIKAIINLLVKEHLVVIYPESRIFTDGLMGPFKEGAFYFLRRRISPVVPVIIKGLERITADSFLGRHVRIAFLDPIFPVDTIGMKENAIAQKIKTIMEEAYDAL